MDANALRQALIKALVAAATGQPSDFDVWTPELKKAERAAMTELMARPSAAVASVIGQPDVPGSDQPDSDQVDPASTDETAAAGES